MSMKNSNDTIGNRTRDFPAWISAWVQNVKAPYSNFWNGVS